MSCLCEPGLWVIVTKGYVEPVDTGQAALGLGGKRDWWHETHSAKDGHILCFVVMTVVVPRQHTSTKRTQSSMGGLVIGKPVAVVSKVENSVAFLHLQYQNFFLQRPKSKFGLSLLGTHIGNWNLDQYFQSTDFLVDLMSYMLRCTMLLVKATTRTAFFTL